MTELMTGSRATGGATSVEESERWPTSHVDFFLDEVERLSELVAGWPERTWQLLDLLATADARAGGACQELEAEAREQARVRAVRRACIAGRTAMLQYAERAVTSGIPGSVSSDAVWVLRDAVLAMVTVDLLAEDDERTLMRRLATAAVVLPSVSIPVGE